MRRRNMTFALLRNVHDLTLSIGKPPESLAMPTRFLPESLEEGAGPFPRRLWIHTRLWRATWSQPMRPCARCAWCWVCESERSSRDARHSQAAARPQALQSAPALCTGLRIVEATAAAIGIPCPVLGRDRPDSDHLDLIQLLDEIIKRRRLQCGLALLEFERLLYYCGVV